MPLFRPSFLRATCATTFVWLAVAFCCSTLFPSCNDAAPGPTDQEPLEFHQDISHPTYLGAGTSFSFHFSAVNLAIHGKGASQRALFASPDLQVVDATGLLLLHLTAKSAISLAPYKDFSFVDFSLQNEDSATFEGENLVWPYLERRDRVGLLGPTLLLAPTFLVECDTVVGDLLLRAYEILHVKSATDLRTSSADSINSANGQ
jgi:hypothetical protein